MYFEIDWHASGVGNSNNIEVSTGIEKNGSVTLCSGMSQTLKESGKKYALSGTCVVELAQNDTIEPVITADGNGDVITVENFTATIRPFFR